MAPEGPSQKAGQFDGEATFGDVVCDADKLQPVSGTIPGRGQSLSGARAWHKDPASKMQPVSGTVPSRGQSLSGGTVTRPRKDATAPKGRRLSSNAAAE
jgi:hypothetical protein